MTRQAFNEAEWIEDLAVALEQVAAEAQPSYYPLPVETSGYRSSAERRSVLRRGYGALAARAKHDPTASIQFRESYLQIRSEPVEAIAILRKHPLMKPGLEGSARDESIGFRVLGRSFSSNLRGLVERLAKLSVKEGGVAAARRLHRYLTAGANGAVPAHEITVIHGLVVKTRFKLYAGAYVAPYGDARTEFELPHEPEPMSKNSLPDAAVLVRSLEYGPGVAPLDQDPGLPDVQVTYRFPAQYRVDLEGWFDERALLVDLLSIAARAPLLARTRYVRVARWIDEINPNFAFGAQDSQGFVSDVWPQGHELSKGDIDAFLGMARGWRKWPHRVGSMDLAIRPGGWFVLSSGRAIRTGRPYSRRCHRAGSALWRRDRPQALGAGCRTAWSDCQGAEADIRPGKGVLWCAIEDRALEEPVSLTRRSRQGAGGRAQSSLLHARELAYSRRATGVGSHDEKPAT